MTVAFNSIPGNVRVPFMYFEINAGQSPYVSSAALLIMGQKTTAGTALADTPIQVTGGEDGLFGLGSQAAAMYKMARSVGAFQEIWVVPLADAGGSAKAAGGIAINSPPTQNGSLVFYIGDIRVQVPVTVTMTAAAIATATIAAINACIAMQVKASQGAAGTVATGTLTYTGPATAPGLATATINGVTVSTPYIAAATATSVAAAIAAAINAHPYLNNIVTATPAVGVVTVTTLSAGVGLNAYGLACGATATTGVAGTAGAATLAGGASPVVTLTANNGGTLGNTIGITLSPIPTDPATAALITTITPMATGSGDPVITTALANLGDHAFDWIAMPYVSYIEQLEVFLEARWAYSSQLYGFGVTVYEATAGQQLALGATLNGPYTAILGVYNTPAPSYLWCAAIAAQAAVHLQDAPELSRPLQTLPLPGLSPPRAIGDRWTALQRQSFYFAGISACTERRDGTVVIDRLISTYQTNAWGSPDQTWLDCNTLAQTMYGVRFLKQLVSSTYPRSALANSNPNNLQGVCTANDIRNTIVHGYKQLCALGVFDDAATFDQLLIVERNTQDPDRIDCFLPLEMVGQLRILAANARIFLQYPTS